MTDRVVLDACVLYPTLLRQMLLSTARAGLFTPLWSSRILGEWHHAAARSGPVEADLVKAEIALHQSRFPTADISPSPDLEETLYLPDPDDRHVLAAAIEAEADAILTLNLKDFPTRTLSGHGILRYEPDLFLCNLRAAYPEADPLLRAPLARAASDLGTAEKSLLKKSRLLRLAKAMGL